MSNYYSKDDAVAIVPLNEYTEEGARAALTALLNSVGGLDFVKKGMHIVIKANLEGEKDTKWNLQEKRNFRKDAQNTSYKLKRGKKTLFF